MADVKKILPELKGNEQVFIQSLLLDMNDTQAERFATDYRVKRKSPTTILIATLLGFLGLAGIQRFLVGHIGLGLFYLVTVGVAGVATIFEVFNHQKLSLDYNKKQAEPIAIMAKGSE